MPEYAVSLRAISIRTTDISPKELENMIIIQYFRGRRDGHWDELKTSKAILHLRYRCILGLSEMCMGYLDLEVNKETMPKPKTRRQCGWGDYCCKRHGRVQNLIRDMLWLGTL